MSELLYERVMRRAVNRWDCFALKMCESGPGVPVRGTFNPTSSDMSVDAGECFFVDLLMGVSFMTDL